MSAIINRLCDHLRQLLDPIVPSHIDVWMAQQVHQYQPLPWGASNNI